MPKEVSLDSPFEEIYKNKHEFPQVYVKLAQLTGSTLPKEWKAAAMSQLGRELIEHRFDVSPVEHTCPQCGNAFLTRNPKAMYDKPYCRFKASRDRRALEFSNPLHSSEQNSLF